MKFLKYLRKKWHNDILYKVEQRDDFAKEVMDQQEKNKNEILAALSWNNLEVIRFRDGLIRTTPRKTIKLCFDIIEECNLNCAGCLVYSPLVRDNGYVMTVSSFERDIEKISQIFNENEIDVITISGGEPLLHKDIEKFPQIIRKYFEKVNIRIVTNGLLLLKQPTSFWKSCKENRVVLEQTKYPINLDFEEIAKTAIQNGVKHIYMDDTGEKTKTMQIFPLDLESMSEKAINSQNERLNFFNCWEANQCIRVQEGRMYTCSRIPHVNLLNDYFDLDYVVTEDDSINFYEVKDKNEVYKFLASATRFCKYCKVHAISEGHEWSASKKTLDEWAN